MTAVPDRTCAPNGCRCACHTPMRHMHVAHVVPCCGLPSEPVHRYGLTLDEAAFDRLGEDLERINEAERHGLAYG